MTFLVNILVHEGYSDSSGTQLKSSGTNYESSEIIQKHNCKTKI